MEATGSAALRSLKLQWGRGLKTAETIRSYPNRMVTYRFNGAAV